MVGDIDTKYVVPSLVEIICKECISCSGAKEIAVSRNMTRCSPPGISECGSLLLFNGVLLGGHIDYLPLAGCSGFAVR